MKKYTYPVQLMMPHQALPTITHILHKKGTPGHADGMHTGEQVKN